MCGIQNVCDLTTLHPKNVAMLTSRQQLVVFADALLVPSCQQVNWNSLLTTSNELEGNIGLVISCLNNSDTDLL